MIISLGSPGQLGNKLIYLAHIIATALEEKIKVRLCVQAGLIGKLPNLNAEKLLEIYEINVGFYNCMQNVCRYILPEGKINVGNLAIVNEKNSNFPFEMAEFLGLVRSSHIIYRGWAGRNGIALIKHRESVKVILSFCSAEYNEVDNMLNSHGLEERGYIGVHVRRGDYRNFKNGLYWFEDNFYIDVALKAAREYSVNKIIVVSNESVVWPIKSGEVEIVIASSSPERDMIILSKAICIVGPPSTFSRWASFIGDVDRYELNHDKGFSMDECIKYIDSFHG